MAQTSRRRLFVVWLILQSLPRRCRTESSDFYSALQEGNSCVSPRKIFSSRSRTDCLVSCNYDHQKTNLCYDSDLRLCTCCSDFRFKKSSEVQTNQQCFKKVICPTGWTRVRSACLFLQNVHTDTSISECKNQCQTSGGRVLTFKSQEEIYEVEKVLKSSSEKGLYWLGMETNTSGQWFYTDTGSPVEFQAWLGDEPNGLSNNEYCAAFKINEPSGFWDVPCSYNIPCVCQL